MALRKAWRWVGAFGPDVMLCVATASVGGLRRSWWAVWDGERLHEGTRGVALPGSHASVRDGGVELDLALEGGRAVQAHNDVAWTVKTPLRVTGTVMLGDRRRALDAPGLYDLSRGRHPRRTSWLWSAGAGTTAAGVPVFWNLVEGMFEGECAVWVDGEPHRVGRLAFDGLNGVGDLRFDAVATRAKRENYVVLASDYEQPFGTFAGSLPVAGRVTGRGVMERHEALW
jgi:hypothetical protein